MKTARIRFALRFVPAIVGVLAIAGAAATTPADYEFHTFPYPGSPTGAAFGITNQGLATGWYVDPIDFSVHGFLYTVTDGYVTVDVPLPGASGVGLYQPNQHGQVAVSYKTADGKYRGAVYDVLHNAWTYLPDPDPTAFYSSPSCINDRGQVFGSWTDASFQKSHGFMYEKGRYTFIDAPEGPGESFSTVLGTANDRGDVVGTYFGSDGLPHNFIRYGNTGRFESIDLPPDIAPFGSIDYAVNNQGTIVGFYADEAGAHGYIMQNGQITTLDVPGASDTYPTAINDRGDITGYVDKAPDYSTAPFIAFRKGK